MLEKFMQQLNKELELGGVPLTEVPGVYALDIDEGVTITITEDGKGIHFSCHSFAEMPKGEKSDLLMEMMQANMMGAGTGGAVLGVEEDEEHPCLTYTIDSEVNYKLFSEALEDFFSAVDYWREESAKSKEG